MHYPIGLLLHLLLPLLLSPKWNYLKTRPESSCGIAATSVSLVLKGFFFPFVRSEKIHLHGTSRSPCLLPNMSDTIRESQGRARVEFYFLQVPHTQAHIGRVGSSPSVHYHLYCYYIIIKVWSRFWRRVKITPGSPGTRSGDLTRTQAHLSLFSRLPPRHPPLCMQMFLAQRHSPDCYHLNLFISLFRTHIRQSSTRNFYRTTLVSSIWPHSSPLQW